MTVTTEAHQPTFEIEGPRLRIRVENGEVTLRLALVHSVQVKRKVTLLERGDICDECWTVLVDGYIVQSGENEDGARRTYDLLNAAVFA